MAHEPTTERGRKSRDRIVAAAVELIDDRGVAGAGIDQILAAAGASKSQLYHYFDDKDDLVRAVVACRFQQVLEAQMPQLAHVDSWAGIRRWLDWWVVDNEAKGFPGCPIGSLANELAPRDEIARFDLAECFSGWAQYLTQGLERMKARGQLMASADPADLATAVLASLQGGLLLASTHKDAKPLRVALDAAFAHLRSFRSTAGG